MEDEAELYSVKLPKSIKKMIRVLSAQRECTQQDLLSELVRKESERMKNGLKITV